MKKTVLATLMAFSSVVIFGTSALAAGSTPITIGGSNCKPFFENYVLDG